ncbi:uncharacterized protein VP01_3082g1 [Puccinia sorghi]|uniref:Uncharacterized protein n=1 Tax=Puccinia sorghi TaxID=27349 RepID=A0A0L6V1H2_9BASI|nr:uncharacterized protein VP01_3082g1 [Puccinia sorghi]
MFNYFHTDYHNATFLLKQKSNLDPVGPSDVKPTIQMSSFTTSTNNGGAKGKFLSEPTKYKSAVDYPVLHLKSQNKFFSSCKSHSTTSSLPSWTSILWPRRHSMPSSSTFKGQCDSTKLISWIDWSMGRPGHPTVDDVFAAINNICCGNNPPPQHALSHNNNLSYCSGTGHWRSNCLVLFRDAFLPQPQDQIRTWFIASVTCPGQLPRSSPE